MLGWTIDDIAAPALRTLAATDTVARAQQQATQRPDEPIVVLDATGYPGGVLTAAAVAASTTPGATLASLAAQWKPVTITRPGTPLTVLFEGLLLPFAPNWHVVWDTGAVTGIAAPQVLAAAFNRLMDAPPDSLPAALEQWRIDFGRLHLSPTLFYSGLPGDPLVPPDARCFYCPGGGTPHRLSPEQVTRYPGDTRAYCRLHPGAALAVENPCRGDDDD